MEPRIRDGGHPASTPRIVRTVEPSQSRMVDLRRKQGEHSPRKKIRIQRRRTVEGSELLQQPVPRQRHLRSTKEPVRDRPETQMKVLPFSEDTLTKTFHE